MAMLLGCVVGLCLMAVQKAYVCLVAMLMAVQKAYVCFSGCARERLRTSEGLPLGVDDLNGRVCLSGLVIDECVE